jgi:glycerate dehydrogenase
MEKIVVTDGYTLNPGDLSWDALHRFGEVTVYDRTGLSQIHERCVDATIIVTNKTSIDESMISKLKRLKIIAVTATGYNVVDVAAAKRNQIFVCNVPGYGTDSVAQHTFALLLELTNRVGKNSQSVANGEWSSSIDWCFVDAPITELSGKTLGVVGYGKIGERVSKIAETFGMEVIYHSPSKKTTHRKLVTLEELFTASDVVSLHCPLTESNKSFVNANLLSLMKPSSFLVNTSRGQLINEHDLAAALRTHKIAGAALDVLSQEPPPTGHPLIGLQNCIITPHNAWLSVEARQRILAITVDNIAKALSGRPQNIVNG